LSVQLELKVVYIFLQASCKKMYAIFECKQPLILIGLTNEQQPGKNSM